ncbi:MAG: ATP-binding cassette domain-containing protein [Ruminococcus sp.]|jgi:ABC-type transport system involved in cytochrome bd biosynthesis fused ATPase/permease subunit|nr:ATP-binding cassette domain-containing protein [Ruminococcus sp.]
MKERLKPKRLVYFITAIALIVLIWIFGYGQSVTFFAILLLALYGLFGTSIKVMADELAERRRIVENGSEDVKKGIVTIRSLGNTAFEMKRYLDGIEDYSEIVRMYLRFKFVHGLGIKLVIILAVIGVLYLSLMRSGTDEPAKAVFTLAGTIAALSALAMSYNDVKIPEEKFELGDTTGNDDFVINDIPANPLGAAIDVNAVAYSYNGESPAIAGISLKIAAGERFGIIGRTNSGKTTLLDIITNSKKPDSGEIYIDGAGLKYMTAELADYIYSERVVVFDGVKPLREITGKTVIIASQITADVMDCGRIAVIDGGMIEAIGTHESLLSNNLLYRELFAAENPDAYIPPREGDFSELLREME